MVRTSPASALNMRLWLTGLIACTLILGGERAVSQEDADDLEIKNSAEVKAVEDAAASAPDEPEAQPSSHNNASEADEKAPWVAPVRTMDPCYDRPEVAKLRAMASVLRYQKFVTSHTPTDLLLRCNESSVDLVFGQDTREGKVKTSTFSSESEEKSNAIDVYAMAGGGTWRYGIQLEHIATKLKSSLNSDGAAQLPETGSIATNALRLETAMRFSNLSLGAHLHYTSAKAKRTFSVAGSKVTTTGEQISLLQPGLALNWKIQNTEVLLGRVQGAEDSKKSETYRLPWATYLRVIRLLEQDQGLRVQFERSGALDLDSTEFNKGLIAYFLSVDNATVDIAWFGRSSSYKSSADATGDQIGAFGFIASLIWQFMDTAELYASIHSVNANDTLGGAGNRSAHENIFGMQLGSQYIF